MRQPLSEGIRGALQGLPRGILVIGHAGSLFWFEELPREVQIVDDQPPRRHANSAQHIDANVRLPFLSLLLIEVAGPLQ